MLLVFHSCESPPDIAAGWGTWEEGDITNLVICNVILSLLPPFKQHLKYFLHDLPNIAEMEF